MPNRHRRHDVLLSQHLVPFEQFIEMIEGVRDVMHRGHRRRLALESRRRGQQGDVVVLVVERDEK
jgi:hypothetical protein